MPDPGLFTFTRSGSTNFAVTVNFVFGGTAVSGVDYRAPGNSVRLAPGATSTNVAIMLLVNSNLVGAKTVILALSSNPSYSVGTPQRATITIAGNSGPITSITIDNGVATLTWASVPGIVYQVLSRNSLLSGNWSAVSPSIIATDALTSWSDSSASTGQRFYRILQTP